MSQGLTGFPGAAGRMGAPGPAVSMARLCILIEGEKKLHAHWAFKHLRALLDPLAPLEPLAKMVPVEPVETLAPLAHLESRVWLDHMVLLETRDLLESLVLV